VKYQVIFFVLLVARVGVVSAVPGAHQTNATAVVDEIERLFKEKGNESYMINEPITQWEHAWQAACIARAAGADEPSIVGALLHDIGNFVGPHVGDAVGVQTTHAQLGSKWLKKQGFPQKVVDCAYWHAFAKVYLCEVDSSYKSTLSRASQESYEAQKGQFSDEMRRQLIRLPYFGQLLAVRRCDDMAKLPGIASDPFTKWRSIIIRVLEGTESVYANHEWVGTIEWLYGLSLDAPEKFKKIVYESEPSEDRPC